MSGTKISGNKASNFTYVTSSLTTGCTFTGNNRGAYNLGGLTQSIFNDHVSGLNISAVSVDECLFKGTTSGMLTINTTSDGLAMTRSMIHDNNTSVTVTNNGAASNMTLTKIHNNGSVSVNGFDQIQTSKFLHNSHVTIEQGLLLKECIFNGNDEVILGVVGFAGPSAIDFNTFSENNGVELNGSAGSSGIQSNTFLGNGRATGLSKPIDLKIASFITSNVFNGNNTHIDISGVGLVNRNTFTGNNISSGIVLLNGNGIGDFSQNTLSSNIGTMNFNTIVTTFSTNLFSANVSDITESGGALTDNRIVAHNGVTTGLISAVYNFP
jgi:hypothetical protein